MYITAQGCRLRNDLYCVEWDVKIYYTIPVQLVALETGKCAHVQHCQQQSAERRKSEALYGLRIIRLYVHKVKF